MLLTTSAGPGDTGRQEDGGEGFGDWGLQDRGSDWTEKVKERQGANDSCKQQGEIGGVGRVWAKGLDYTEG